MLKKKVYFAQSEYFTFNTINNNIYTFKQYIKALAAFFSAPAFLPLLVFVKNFVDLPEYASPNQFKSIKLLYAKLWEHIAFFINIGHEQFLFFALITW
jgi:hypothetical protein